MQRVAFIAAGVLNRSRSPERGRASRAEPDRRRAPPGCRRRRRGGCRGDGGHRQGRILRGRRRPARAGSDHGHDARHGLPHRVDDQGHHVGRGDAVGRAGQAEARRTRAQHRPYARLTAGAGRVRRLWRAEAPSGQAADHAAASADAHGGLRLRAMGPEHQSLREDLRAAAAGHRQAGDDPHAAGVRFRRPLALRHQHRLGGPPRRSHQRAAARRVLPGQDLHTARHERQRVTNPRPISAPVKRACTRGSPTEASRSSRSRLCRPRRSSGRAAARCTPRRATT